MSARRILSSAVVFALCTAPVAAAPTWKNAPNYKPCEDRAILKAMNRMLGYFETKESTLSGSYIDGRAVAKDKRIAQQYMGVDIIAKGIKSVKTKMSEGMMILEIYHGPPEDTVPQDCVDIRKAKKGNVYILEKITHPTDPRQSFVLAHAIRPGNRVRLWSVIDWDIPDGDAKDAAKQEKRLFEHADIVTKIVGEGLSLLPDPPPEAKTPAPPVVTPKTPSQPKWKTVKSTKHGCSITVPPGWYADKSGAVGDIAICLRNRDSNFLLVEVNHAEAPLLNKGQLKEAIEGLAKGNPIFTKKLSQGVLKVDGGIGVSAVFTGKHEDTKYKTLAHVISTDGRFFFITGTMPTSADNKTWDTISKILNSFKF